MKITNDDLMDYTDGTLDASRLAAVQAHLAAHADDAALVTEMLRMRSMLGDIETHEPIVVSEDFWPRLRDKLPARPPRSPLRRAVQRTAAWLWPAHAPLRQSVRVGAVAVLLVMAASLLSPRQATHDAVADSLSQSDKTFIQQSLSKHSAYDSAEPASVVPLAPEGGPATDGDGSADPAGDQYVP